MMCNIWGPTSVRHNDSYTLAQSNILQRLAAAQVNLPDTYCTLGSSAYYAGRCLRTYHRGEDADLTERHKFEKLCMKPQRECIEWDYGTVGSLWAKTDFKYGLKLRS